MSPFANNAEGVRLGHSEAAVVETKQASAAWANTRGITRQPLYSPTMRGNNSRSTGAQRKFEWELTHKSTTTLAASVFSEPQTRSCGAWSTRVDVWQLLTTFAVLMAISSVGVAYWSICYPRHDTSSSSSRSGRNRRHKMTYVVVVVVVCV